MLHMSVASAHMQQKKEKIYQLITNEKLNVVDFPLLDELTGAKTIASTNGSTIVPSSPSMRGFLHWERERGCEHKASNSSDSMNWSKARSKNSSLSPSSETRLIFWAPKWQERLSWASPNAASLVLTYCLVVWLNNKDPPTIAVRPPHNASFDAPCGKTGQNPITCSFDKLSRKISFLLGISRKISILAGKKQNMAQKARKRRRRWKKKGMILRCNNWKNVPLQPNQTCQPSVGPMPFPRQPHGHYFGELIQITHTLWMSDTPRSLISPWGISFRWWLSFISSVLMFSPTILNAKSFHIIFFTHKCCTCR